MTQTKARATALALMFVVAGCPTRRNPALEELEDVCGAGSQLCDERCVAEDDRDHCGGCGRACIDEAGCDCDGEPPTCLDQAGHQCFDGCDRGDLLCEVAGVDQCVHQPDKSHCGACGVACAEDPGCECRESGGTGDLSCLRSRSGGFADCTL